MFLVELLKRSSRFAEYAKRTEMIELCSMEAKGGTLNELSTSLFEVCCNAKTLRFENLVMWLSTVGKLLALKSLNQMLTWEYL